MTSFYMRKATPERLPPLLISSLNKKKIGMRNYFWDVPHVCM